MLQKRERSNGVGTVETSLIEVHMGTYRKLTRLVGIGTDAGAMGARCMCAGECEHPKMKAEGQKTHSYIEFGLYSEDGDFIQHLFDHLNPCACAWGSVL